jgi:hypothetical protein
MIPDGATTIGDHAFGHCASLASIVIPDGVTSSYFMSFMEAHSLH